jgi:signal transduction histidine kinase
MRHIDILVCAAMLLALISLLLFWRQQRLADSVALAKRQLAEESRLRTVAERALLDTHASLSKMTALQADIKQGERQRIRRDIHDDLGQHLLTLKIDICMLHLSSAGAHPAMHQRLGLIARNIDGTVQSLRRIINDLHPHHLQTGLKAAVEWQLDEFSRVSGIPHELDAGIGVFDAGAHIDMIVFRILQESLSNITRHAKARSVKVALRRNAGSLLMTVRDDGIGLPAGRLRRGCGLKSIEDRISAVGGQFLIDSQPGRGTALSLAIPLMASAIDA